MPIRLLSMLRNRLFGEPDPAEESGQPGAGNSDEQPTAALDPAPPEQPATLPESETPAASDEVIAARQERAASRILEDERLRGDLADDELQPLLDWALSVTDRIAAGTGGLGNAEANSRIDAAIGVIRDVVGAAGAVVGAHNEGDAERRSSELTCLGERSESSMLQGVDEVDQGAVSGRLDALAERLNAEPDVPGAEVAALIVQALTPAPDSEPRLDSPTASQGKGENGVGESHQEGTT